jgi:hypothetical protein
MKWHVERGFIWHRLVVKKKKKKRIIFIFIHSNVASVYFHTRYLIKMLVTLEWYPHLGYFYSVAYIVILSSTAYIHKDIALYNKTQ